MKWSPCRISWRVPPDGIVGRAKAVRKCFTPSRAITDQSGAPSLEANTCSSLQTAKGCGRTATSLPTVCARYGNGTSEWSLNLTVTWLEDLSSRVCPLVEAVRVDVISREYGSSAIIRTGDFFPESFPSPFTRSIRI